MPRSLVVKITHADDDPERAHIACNVAAVSLAAGLDVHVFLAIEGVRLALPDGLDAIEVADAPPIGDLLDAVYAGGTLTVCTPCATRRGLGPDDFRAGTQMAGSARFVELATLDGAQALVY
jgi:predicted peroxiredoxin